MGDGIKGKQIKYGTHDKLEEDEKKEKGKKNY